MEKYRQYLEQSSLSENTRRVYIAQAEKFNKFAKEEMIEKRTVDSYSALLTQYKPATNNLYRVALNQYLKWLGLEECRCKVRRIQGNRCLKNVLSVEEYVTLLNYARDTQRLKYYFIMRLFASNGMRVGELSAITVEAVRRGGTIVYNKEKYREIFIPNKLAKELLEYCRNETITEGCIFTGNRGKPISRSGVWQMFQKIADMTGVPGEKVHPHSFRHMFAKEYMNRYGNLPELADILGHSSLEVTRIYTVTTAEEKRNRLDQLGL